MKKTSFIRKQSFFRLAMVVAILVFINIISSPLVYRWDRTDDLRFTITDSTKAMLKNLKGSVFVKIYLKGSDLQPGFIRLADATIELLDEFKNYSGSKLQYQFTNPFEGKTEAEQATIARDLAKCGLSPTKVKVKSDDAYSEKIIVPCASISFNNGVEYPINLLQDENGLTPAEALNTSVAKLENQFATVIRSLAELHKPTIGYITGHGEIPAPYTVDIDTALRMFYNIKQIDLPNSFVIDSKYSCIIIAKPRFDFQQSEKFLLDQYLMHGGKILWLVESQDASNDSLAKKPSFVSMPYPLSLNEDLFFRCGFRLNVNLVEDLRCEEVPIKTNLQGSQNGFTFYKNFFLPVYQTNQSGNPIVKNIDNILAQYSATLDTVKADGIKKTVLLHTSIASKTVGGGPWTIDYREFINEPDENTFRQKNLITGLLCEGIFHSNYKNRVPESFLNVWRDSLHQTFLEQSPATKLIVLSDGDLIKNGYNRNGLPETLGYYPYTQELFSNKKFLLNCIDYLTGYTGNMETRSKIIALRLLDAAKVKAEKTKWQIINMTVPILFVLLFGFVFTVVRQYRFAKK